MEILLRGDQGKTAEKVGRLQGLENDLAANCAMEKLVSAESAILAKHFGANHGSRSARGAELEQIWQGHLNRPFLEILLRGDQRKTAQKVGRIQGLENHLCANRAIE